VHIFRDQDRSPTHRIDDTVRPDSWEFKLVSQTRLPKN